MPVAIVTGGNSGIGRATAVSLASAGFDVGITWHRDEDRVESLKGEVEAHGRRYEAVHLDLHDLAGGPQAVDDLAERLGGLDALVNNAGYGTSKPFLEMELAEWQGVIDVNLTGAFLCAQAAAKRMVAQGRGGRIVNVTSVHEHIPLEGSAPYTASKHGLGGLTKLMALELAEHGITVNSVAPGQIATRMTGQEDSEPAPSEGIPLGRAGHAEEVAALVTWLCSADSSYVTGASYVVDGGLMLIAAQHQ
ncbi:MAG TPA: SDR family oxidoreductase [Solirubrobacteraceae bacterium]|nr:SDR family oxidoreductase [Solirubrobacteraceae bacterium]